MRTEQTLEIDEVVQKSAIGQLSFPEVVARLAEIGVERYHADYSRQESTYYLASGESHVVAVPRDAFSPPQTFSATAVEDAVRQSQLGLHSYEDFVRKTVAAGCVGYFVQITGRQVIYFGRNGEMHIEKFPPIPATRSQIEAQ